MRPVGEGLDGLDTRSDRREELDGQDEEKHEVLAGIMSASPTLDTSLCERVPQEAVRLRSHHARGHVKLGVTSSWKGYARDFYRAASLLTEV